MVKEFRIGEGAPQSGSPDSSGSTPSGGALRHVLAVIVGLALLAVIIPLGLLAVGCVAVVAFAIVLVWGLRRIFGRRPGTAGPTIDVTMRENVRVKTPNEA